jgi:hypothetical protein
VNDIPVGFGSCDVTVQLMSAEQFQSFLDDFTYNVFQKMKCSINNKEMVPAMEGDIPKCHPEETLLTSAALGTIFYIVSKAPRI